MMKWFLTLFATYMLVLPCIPCNAAEACCKEEQALSAVKECCPGEERDCAEEDHSNPAEGSDHHEHSPICPCCPSFSCNTCHSLVISAHFMLEEPGIPALHFDNDPFADGPLTSFSALIWQPPRGLC